MESFVDVRGDDTSGSSAEGTPVAAASAPVQASERDTDLRWYGVARWSGIVAGGAFVVGSGLYAISSFGLGTGPEFTLTTWSAKEEATFMVAAFAWTRQHLWLLVLQALVIALGYLAILPLMLAVNALTGARRALVQLAAGLLAGAALFGVLSRVIYLAACEFWRVTGWENVPPEAMVAVGRQTGALSSLSAMIGEASFGIFAVGMAFLGAACRSEARLPRWLAPVTWIGAALVLAMVVVGEMPNTGYAGTVLSLLGGVVIAPLVMIVLGVHLGRGSRSTTA